MCISTRWQLHNAAEGNAVKHVSRAEIRGVPVRSYNATMQGGCWTAWVWLTFKEHIQETHPGGLGPNYTTGKYRIHTDSPYATFLLCCAAHELL